MAEAQPLQSSFAYGEISPRLLGRSDTERYRQSVRLCEDVITLSHGNAVKRPGTRYIVKSPTEGNIRLFDMQLSPLEPYVVELGWETGAGYLRVLDRNGYVLGSPQYVQNYQFLDGLRAWVDNSATGASVVWEQPSLAKFVPLGPSYVFNALYNYQTGNGTPGPGVAQHQQAGGQDEIQFNVIDVDGIDRTQELLRLNSGDTVVINATTYTLGALILSADVFFASVTPTTFETPGQYDMTFTAAQTPADARLQQQVTVANPALSHRLDALVSSNVSATFPLTVKLGTTQGGAEIDTIQLQNGENTGVVFTPGAGNGTFWVSVESFGADYTEAFDIFLDALTIHESSATVFEVPTPWSEEDLDDLTSVLSTKEDALYFAVGTQPPHRLTRTSAGTFLFEQITFTNQPAAWAAGNYPHAVTFHQQRLWYAATPQQPDTLWGSKTGDFLDFDLGTGQPADGIEFEMSDRGNIEWVQGTRDLLAGTDVGEYVITSEGGVIIPGDIQSQQQSAYGSGHQEPVEVGNGVLYLGADRRRIRFMNYQFLEEGWVSLDLTWPSEHVTEPLVKEMHFRYAPDPLIWCVLQDGSTISAIYEREQNNLVGWHRHPALNNVKSAALMKLGAGTELWVAVERDVVGSTATYIERTETVAAVGPSVRETPEPLNIRSDSAVVSNVISSGGVLIVLGLDHLEGHIVRPVIDGAVHIDRKVDNGQILIQPGFAQAGDIAVVGLAFEGRLLTLPLEGLNQRGTSQATKMRRNRIFLRLLESALPVVNGITTGARFPLSPMDETEPDFTGDLQIGGLGWDRFAAVDVRMPLPRHYNILSIFGDAQSNTP